MKPFEWRLHIVPITMESGFESVHWTLTPGGVQAEVDFPGDNGARGLVDLLDKSGLVQVRLVKKGTTIILVNGLAVATRIACTNSVHVEVTFEKES